MSSQQRNSERAEEPSKKNKKNEKEQKKEQNEYEKEQERLAQEQRREEVRRLQEERERHREARRQSRVENGLPPDDDLTFIVSCRQIEEYLHDRPEERRLEPHYQIASDLHNYMQQEDDTPPTLRYLYDTTRQRFMRMDDYIREGPLRN